MRCPFFTGRALFFVLKADNKSTEWISPQRVYREIILSPKCSSSNFLHFCVRIFVHFFKKSQNPSLECLTGTKEQTDFLNQML